MLWRAAVRVVHFRRFTRKLGLGTASLLLFGTCIVTSVALFDDGVSAQESSISVDGSRADISVVERATIREGSAAPGQRPYWPWRCRWLESGILNGEERLNFFAPTGEPVPGDRYFLECRAKSDGSVAPFNRYLTYNPIDPIPGQNVMTSITVRNVARDFLIVPDLSVGSSPAETNIVGLAIWLWPEGDTRTRYAQAVGNALTVTVEARWRQTTFVIEGSEDEPILCSEQTMWEPATDSSGCTHMFFHTGEGIGIEATSEWDLYWWDNDQQPQPVLWETVVLDETREVDVIDLEAVIRHG